MDRWKVAHMHPCTHAHHTHLKEFVDWVHKHLNILFLFLSENCSKEHATKIFS